VAFARLAASHGDYSEAVAAATTAANLFPDSEHALAVLAAATKAAGNFARAAELADRLVAMAPGSVPYRLDRADVHMRTANWTAAAADARAALKIMPLSLEARAVLAISLTRQGDAAAGRREIDAAVGLAGNQQQKQALRNWYAEMTR
jgi:hypothetical protein